MEFIISPLENNPTPGETNYLCPPNAYQCGCNVVSGCGCPKK